MKKNEKKLIGSDLWNTTEYKMSHLKMIKNEQWVVDDLYKMVKSNGIRNPKFQRKRKWGVREGREDAKRPSEDRYIEFLKETSNSVHAISVGISQGVYTNIDGNNRINAIVHFLERPLDIFPTYFDEFSNLIHKLHENAEIRDKTISLFREITYFDAMEWKAKTYFAGRNESAFYNEHLKKYSDEICEHIEEIQHRLKLSNGNRFDTHVKININVFEGYNTDELCRIFEKINKYNSCLTESELLASRLYCLTDFVIDDAVLQALIMKELRLYYEKKNRDERLIGYNFENNDINAFDFMAGLQNYAFANNQLFFEEFTNDGVPLFFKVFKVKYQSDYAVAFTSKNVNQFINYIQLAINVFSYVNKQIHMGISGSSCFNKKIKSFGRNRLYLLIVIIIGLIDEGASQDKITRIVEQIVLFHMFVEDIVNKETKLRFRELDILQLEAGGTYIDNMATRLLLSPSNASVNIGKFGELINVLYAENINSIPDSSEKPTRKPPRRFYEKMLLYYYYKTRVPVCYLDKEFELEHLVPFSSSWTNESIDIDRLGNTVPIINTLNRKRQNKHISEYGRIVDGDQFMSYFKDIVPSVPIYDSIVKHDGKMSVCIINGSNYNTKCAENEAFYKHVFLSQLG